MGFIHEHPINTQLLKSDNIVLSVIGLAFFKSGFQTALGTFQLLNRERFAAAGFYLGNTLGDIPNLFLKQSLLPLLADGDTFKLAVPNDDGIIIAGGNSGTELLSVMGFKVLFGSDKDIGRGLQPQERRRPLLGQVVRNHEHGLLAKSQPLALLGSGVHLEGLACPHFVCKQCVSTTKHMGNGAFLRFSQSDFWVRARKNKRGEKTVVEFRFLDFKLAGGERFVKTVCGR